MARIFVHLDNIVKNLKIAKTMCKECGAELIVVTKCCGSDSVILNHLIENGADMIAESHPGNYKNINDSITKTCLLTRLSALKEKIPCDYLFISELEILKKLSNSPFSKIYQVIIPVEVGDMREGVPPEQMILFMNQAMKIKNINIAGFSANFGCFTELSPDAGRVDSFVRFINHIAETVDFHPKILSIGGSSLWPLLKANKIPEQINQIRIGEAIFLGKDPGLNCPIQELCQDTFILESEIIEIKKKYIKSKNYFKGSPYPDPDHLKQEDIRRQAVIDIGYATAPCTELIPIQSGIKIIGSSQDYMVIDLTDFEKDLSVGHTVKFSMTYKALAKVMTSDNPELEKSYISLKG